MYTVLKYSDGKDITSSTYQNATSIEVTPDWNLLAEFSSQMEKKAIWW